MQKYRVKRKGKYVRRYSSDDDSETSDQSGRARSCDKKYRRKSSEKRRVIRTGSTDGNKESGELSTDSNSDNSVTLIEENSLTNEIVKYEGNFVFFQLKRNSRFTMLFFFY